MGNTFQRLEMLLIGLVLLIAGAIVAVAMIVRPVSPTIYTAATPRPIATPAPEMPTSASMVVPTQMPTLAPLATQASAATTVTEARPSLPRIPLLTPPSMLWPTFLLIVGVVGLALAARRFRRRRLGYINQTVDQLLATADAETRASNVRVMRKLAAQGLLTQELAAAAGIDLAQPAKRAGFSLPRLALPRVTLPHLNIAPVRLPRVQLHKLRAHRVARSIVHAITPQSPSDATSKATLHSTPTLQDRAVTDIDAPIMMLPIAPAIIRMEVPLPSAPADGALPLDKLRAALATEAIERPKAELPGARIDSSINLPPWTAEDRALAVAAALAELWAAEALQSPILAIDTHGSGSVLLTIDIHPNEEDTLHDLPNLLTTRESTWRASWQHGLLDVTLHTADIPPPSGGPLIAPILIHGRSGTTTRFFPLATWRHLGFYGADALGALHALLSSLLYSQPPTHLALAILDRGEIAPLYRDVAHLVELPDSPHTVFERLAHVIGRVAPDVVRPLLLVVVDPDDEELQDLLSIITRLQTRPTAPLHLLIVQTQPRHAGRELYARLPALILSGGTGSAILLPGQGEWPKRGEARLFGRGVRLTGRAIMVDEAAIVQALAPLRQPGMDLPPVLWDVAEPHLMSPMRATPSASATPAKQPHHTAATALDPTERRRRIAEVMIRHRQTLMDTESAPAPFADAGTPTLLDAPGLTNATEQVLTVEDAPPNNIAAESTSADAALNKPVPPDGAAANRRAELLRASRTSGAASAPSLPTFVWSLVPPPPSAAAERPSERQPMQEPENGWPVGPVPLGRVAMADLMSRVVAAPAIVAGQPNELGVTKNRLIDLLSSVSRAEAKELAEILLAWFDQAGLLAEPTKPGRLRHPRALVTTNLIEIATRLNATNCPDKATVGALWAASNEGRQ